MDDKRIGLIFEVISLTQEEVNKLSDQAIINFLTRISKLADYDNLVLRDITDQILRNKLKIAPLQYLLFEKVHKLLPLKNINEDYYNFLLDSSLATLNDLKKKYKLANKTLDLIIDIEKLTETEYEKGYFASNQYMKMYEFQLSMLTFETIEEIERNSAVAEAMIMDQIKNYFESLSEVEKTNLYIESIALSYNRERAILFAEQEIDEYLRMKPWPNKPSISEAFDRNIQRIELEYLGSQDLQTIYKNLSRIYKSSLYKQKIKKK